MKKIVLLSFFIIQSFATPLTNLDIQSALEMVKRDNLEVNIASYQEKIRSIEVDIAKGYNYGKLDLTQNIIHSNDAGNVFGFKLQSREATFNDFGFDEFLMPLGMMMNGMAVNQEDLLNTSPKNLNNPDARTHYQTKLTFQMPLYTGGKLTEYKNIATMLYELSTLDREKTIAEKLFQTKKSFYDISLLNSYIKNLQIVLKNIERLEEMVENMIEEGYAKRVDLLEVEAKKANVERMLNSARSYKKLALDFLSFLLNKNVSSIKDVKTSAKCSIETKEQALENNLDLQKAKLGFSITKRNIKLQESNYLPEAGVFAEYGSANDEFLQEFSEKDFYTVGLGIKWNLFNGEIDKNNLEKAKVENLKVATQLEMAEKGIALQVSKTLTEIETLDYDIQHLKKELELTREVYENYQGRYSENLVSINDVLIKHATEIEKLLQLQKTENQRNEKVFLLEKIANKGEQ